jgi:putative ABC transport system substrate-binding protein
MRRRDFIGLLGGAAVPVYPGLARAQLSGGQAPPPSSAPLIGFLNSASAATYRFNADSFREGLARAGFIEGRNVRIEERWANGDYNALNALATELVAKGVVAIAATGDVSSARAAKAASAAIPVVFTIGGDPVRFGLVESLNRPGGHVTGISFVSKVLGAKRVQLLHELAPNATRIALLMNPDNPNAALRACRLAGRCGKARPADRRAQFPQRGGDRRRVRGARQSQGQRRHRGHRPGHARPPRADRPLTTSSC